ncbi:MAG: hypothetical protein PHQ47_03415, partial [Candidatus Portnoybacteria bacterium]|nr:hypothetical protein [Candidatus Portnoybacteria bacterium]
MPSVITHLAFAQRYLKNNKQNEIQIAGDFFAGAIFPDIRYFARVQRDLTHQRFEPDLDFSKLNDFEAGWKSHIYLDQRWNAFFDLEIPEFKGDPIAATAIKVIEDRID